MPLENASYSLQLMQFINHAKFVVIFSLVFLFETTWKLLLKSLPQHFPISTVKCEENKKIVKRNDRFQFERCISRTEKMWMCLCVCVFFFHHELHKVQCALQIGVFLLLIKQIDNWFLFEWLCTF